MCPRIISDCAKLVFVPVTPPRGMRDILPSEKAARERLLAEIRDTYTARGFQEIETPAMEELERLSSGQGGDNEKLVFKVLKRGEELDRAIESGGELADLGLRFDLTVPLTRFYSSNQGKLPRVLKAIQIGPVWRAERPQKGRYRQFLQCDIDIIGETSQLAELELISASLAALDAIGLPGATIRINDRRLLASLLNGLGITQHQDRALIAIDKLDKIGVTGVVAELQEQFGSEVAERAAEWLAKVSDLAMPAELDWTKSLGPLADRLRFDPTLVRGMGYYTGAIFEIEHPDVDYSIGGGGRYDEMVGRFSGSGAPAVGISLGIERIIDLLPKDSSISKSLVLLVGDSLAGVFAKQQELISEGWSVRIERRAKNLKAQLSELSAAGFESFASFEPGQEIDIKPLA